MSADVPRAHTQQRHPAIVLEVEDFVAICVSESCFSCMHQCFGLMFFISTCGRTGRAEGTLAPLQVQITSKELNLHERN